MSDDPQTIFDDERPGTSPGGTPQPGGTPPGTPPPGTPPPGDDAVPSGGAHRAEGPVTVRQRSGGQRRDVVAGFGDVLDASWKDLLLRGVLAALFGVAAMAWPLTTVLAFVLLWGAWALLDGVGALWQAFHSSGKHRLLLVLIGVVALAAAFLAFVRPGLTAVTLVWLLGLWLIARGVTELVVAFTSASGRARLLVVLAAVLDGLLGVLLVLNHDVGAKALTVFLGVLALAWGLAFVALALVVRRAAKETRSLAQEA